MKRLIAIVLCLASLVLVACSGKKTEEPKTATWEGISTVEVFNQIPAPKDADKLRITAQGDYGADNYVLELSGIMPNVHTDYLKLLKDDGYEVLVDNGISGIENVVYTTTLRKDDITMTLTYVQSQMKMYLSATKYEVKVSPFLTYDEESVKNNAPDAKTTLTMQQVPEYGNFYIIQLKNGHFILNDGGWKDNDVRKITDVLCEMVPEGETPVVDAWFISHEHEDHMFFIGSASSVYDLDDRVRVEGFYVSQVNDHIAEITGAANTVGKTTLLAGDFKNVKGEPTPVYRPHMGERYYFNDITVDVMYTQEQAPENIYVDNLNVSSTWLMYNIEGQKFLLAGDTELINMQYVMQTYSEDYMDVDIMNHHHHCLNIYTDDLNYYAKVETLLYSTWGTYSIYWPKDVLDANLKIQKFGTEVLSYVDGGKRFTFPYTVGEYENLEPLYPETSASLVERQEGWLKDAGLL